MLDWVSGKFKPGDRVEVKISVSNGEIINQGTVVSYEDGVSKYDLNWPIESKDHYNWVLLDKPKYSHEVVGYHDNRLKLTHTNEDKLQIINNLQWPLEQAPTGGQRHRTPGR
jgi:hypothetical protein